MRRSQLIIVIVMAVALAAVLLFPPWEMASGSSTYRRRQPATRSVVFLPPEPVNASSSPTIAVDRLGVEVVAIVLLGAAAFGLTLLRGVRR